MKKTIVHPWVLNAEYCFSDVPCSASQECIMSAAVNEQHGRAFDSRFVDRSRGRQGCAVCRSL